METSLQNLRYIEAHVGDIYLLRNFDGSCWYKEQWQLMYERDGRSNIIQIIAKDKCIWDQQIYHILMTSRGNVSDYDRIDIFDNKKHHISGYYCEVL